MTLSERFKQPFHIAWADLYYNLYACNSTTIIITYFKSIAAVDSTRDNNNTDLNMGEPPQINITQDLLV